MTVTAVRMGPAIPFSHGRAKELSTAFCCMLQNVFFFNG